MRMAVTGKDSGQEIDYNMTLADGKGCEGTFAEQGMGSFKILEIGSAVWILPSETFLKKNGASDPAVLDVVNGKWLKFDKASSSGLGSLASICTASSLTSHLPAVSAGSDTAGLTKAGETTFHGERVLKITEQGEPGAIYVSDTARPDIVTFDDPSSGNGSVVLSGYDAPVTLTAPPADQVLDGSRYGF